MNKLKEYRTKAGIRISDLAKKAGVSYRTISRAEVGGKEMPTEVTLYKILNALNQLSQKNYSLKEVFGSNLK